VPDDLTDDLKASKKVFAPEISAIMWKWLMVIEGDGSGG
jgi:hypothetical protein